MSNAVAVPAQNAQPWLEVVHSGAAVQVLDSPTLDFVSFRCVEFEVVLKNSDDTTAQTATLHPNAGVTTNLWSTGARWNDGNHAGSRTSDWEVAPCYAGDELRVKGSVCKTPNGFWSIQWVATTENGTNSSHQTKSGKWLNTTQLTKLRAKMGASSAKIAAGSFWRVRHY